jgi:hypothetical protein
MFPRFVLTASLGIAWFWVGSGQRKSQVLSELGLLHVRDGMFVLTREVVVLEA